MCNSTVKKENEIKITTPKSIISDKTAMRIRHTKKWQESFK